MKLKNLKIGVRLGLTFLLIILLMTTISVIAIVRLHEVGDATSLMLKDGLEKERAIRDLMMRTEISGARTVAGVRNADPIQQKWFSDQIAATIEGNNLLASKIEKLLHSDVEKALWIDINARRKTAIASNIAIFKEKRAGQEDEAARLLQSRLEPDLNAYLNSMRKLVQEEKRIIDEMAETIADVNLASERLIGMLTCMGILIGVLFSITITRSITRPFREAVAIARSAASGDLRRTITPTSTDETGQLMLALKEMNDSLYRIVSRARLGMNTVADASRQISRGNTELSHRTEQQAAALEETVTAMRRLNDAVDRNADNAGLADQLAQQASTVATRGGKVVKEVIDTMASIHVSSTKIVEIIDVIDGIAFQTNILALNASVEAARAGEQGRGFAVVASEVRNLAQRSATAAKNIKSLIDDSVGQVDTGRKLVERAGKTMQEVVASVQKVTQVISEISSASRHQSEEIEQIQRSVVSMDDATRIISAQVEEAAAAVQSMHRQAEDLSASMQVFTLDESGAAPADKLPFGTKKTALSMLQGRRDAS